jgi:RNA polymerase sigma-70 factor (ECF subfamily)
MMDNRPICNRIGDDDRNGFNGLVREFQASLYIFLFNMVKDNAVAEDLTQDVFVNLWLNRKKIDFDMPLVNYLYVSARNLAYNHIRSEKRFRAHARRFAEPDDSVSLFFIEEETTRLLMNAIGRLTPRTGEVIKYSLEGMRQEKIAERMGIAVATVKYLKADGLKQLRKILGDAEYILLLFFGIL